MRRILALFVQVLLPVGLLFAQTQGQPDQAKGPEWWEVATGVIAIPAALIGLAYSYLLIRKTRLESSKIELEIREKEQQLRHLASNQFQSVESIIQPLLHSKQVQHILLRFIVLFLVLKAWELVDKAFTFLTGGIYLGLSKVINLDLNNTLVVVPFYILQNLPDVGYWLLFLAIGWPLFKDVNRILGMNLRSTFSVRLRQSKDGGA